MRNYFRGTINHNTVSIDGFEQNRFDKQTAFIMKNDSKAKCVNWDVKEQIDTFAGEHYGYNRLKGEMTHRRQITLIKNRVT